MYVIIIGAVKAVPVEGFYHTSILAKAINLLQLSNAKLSAHISLEISIENRNREEGKKIGSKSKISTKSQMQYVYSF